MTRVSVKRLRNPGGRRSVIRALGVAGYRMRATFRHRRGGYLSLVILVVFILRAE